MREASHGMSRTFPPGPPSVVWQGNMPRSKGPGNLLNALGPTPAAMAGVDPRLTVQGTAPGRKMPAYVPFATLDPRNVFSMRPA